MNDLDQKYHEHLLHWIWESLYFDLHNLQSVNGQPITILDTGDLNASDGPDFTNARLQIGDLLWHGDIEFHWSVSDWTKHGHHTDSGYNQVILHIVYYNPDGKQVKREDGTTPFTLHFRPHLPDKLDQLLAAFHQTDQLPCAGQIQYISKEALEQQFEQAHREYFETKTDFLLQFYDPGIGPVSAWKQLFSLGLFDGLGISLNREPMLQVGQLMHECTQTKSKTIGTPDQLRELALHTAGFTQKNDAPSINWNYKGSRPTNHPRRRLLQAATLMWNIQHIPLKRWYTEEPEILWKELIQTVNTETGIGRERSDILYGIVFLPALWLLGNLLHINRLKQQTFDSWMNHHAQLPTSLFTLFARADIPPEIYKYQLGAVYQLKHYCRPRRCRQCKVLKEIISS